MESLSAIVLDMSPSSSSPSRLPRGSLTIIQMLLLNAVVCGVEICACAGFTYVPPLLLKAGYSEENLGYILGLGPLMGFFFVPVIGRASDRCYSEFGRRRPFILGLAILLVVSLYLVPFGEYFASLVVSSPSLARRIGVWGLTVGVVLLDFTTQACLTPCEALLNDASCESEQSEKIFTIYSLMISLGGIIGYLLTAIDWSTNTIGLYFGGQEASVFSILIITFTLLLAATLLVAQEVPLSNSVVPVDIATVSSTPSPAKSLPASPTSSTRPYIAHESGYESSSESSSDESPRLSSSNGSLHLMSKSSTVSRSSTRRVLRRARSRLVRICPKRICTAFTQLFGCIGWMLKQLLPRELVQLFKIPAVLQVLAVADFFSWTAIMGFNIYYSDFMGQVSQYIEIDKSDISDIEISITMFAVYV